MKKWLFFPVAVLWLMLALTAWLKPPQASSDTERRELEQFPGITVESLLDGSFMTDFESYTLDQFPLRDGFRRLKALFHYGVAGQKDNNGIYLEDGYAAQLEYPLNGQSVQHALTVFNKLRQSYLRESRVFYTIVPDKSYYLAGGEYPTMDYDRLFAQMAQGMEGVDYVNLTDLLSIGDYYRTDTHWRQENLLPAAARLCEALGIPVANEADYAVKTAQEPFYGVYYGQAALPMEPDVLRMLESPVISACRVYNFETDRYGSVYDTAKLSGKDLYEVFLSGPVSMLRIENDAAETDRELIVFRDSFGSSMVPLLVHGYRTVTVVDVRYVSSAMLGRFIDFHGQDVLFLYSTLVLNNSFQLK